jgi:hypothetical protein
MFSFVWNTRSNETSCPDGIGGQDIAHRNTSNENSRWQ